jgi:lipoprotein-releasing system permease protein
MNKRAMSRRFEIWIGSRYVRSRSSNRFVSLISAISMLGIAIAVMVLIVVMSVVNGFERELKDRLLAMTAHATIEGVNGDLATSAALLKTAIDDEQVRAAAPYVNGQALLVFEKQLSGAELRGIEPRSEDDVSGIGGVMQEGNIESLTVGDFNIVLGVELANAMHIAVGDKVTVTLAQGMVTPVGVVPRNKRFTVSGIYRVGMYEFDRRLAFININDAQKLYRKRDSVTGVRLAVTEIYEAADIVRRVARRHGELVLVSDWSRRHVNLFRSIQITKSILFVILLLVIAVAAFNIVSTLVMVVKDKQADIAILRTVGARPSSIMRIFMTQGTIVGVAGTLAGVALGMLLASNLESIIGFLEAAFGIKFLAADVYFISDLPSEVRYGDVARIAIIALLLALVSTLYPAWVAAKTAPAEALRYD